MTYWTEIGRRIRELREMKNFTRDYLAEKIDISSKFLYEIETGKKGFSADVLCKMSKALSVSCDYIMEGEEGGQRKNERIIKILENLEPTQKCQLQNMLQILCEITKDE